MRDIVEDLRTAAETDKNQWDVELYERAATEIANLRTEIARLRAVVVLCPKCYEAKHGAGTWCWVVRGE